MNRVYRRFLINCGILSMVIVALHLVFKITSHETYSVHEILNEVSSNRNVVNEDRLSCFNRLMLWTDEVRSNRPKKKDYSCRAVKNWLRINNGRVYLPSLEHNLKCTAQAIIRKGDNEFTLAASVPLHHGDKIPADGFRTKCSDKLTNAEQDMLYGGVLRKDKPSDTPYTGPHYNYLMVSIDSISRLEFERSLPKTLAFFKSKKLEGQVLHSYNIVGDGTPAALQPILTGKNEEELPEARKGRAGASHIDNHPWIFHRLHKLGYVTQWMEEQTDYGTFQMRMMGFRHPPVSHYLRPYMIAQNKFVEGSYCVGSEQQVDRQFHIMKEFFNVYPDKPKFTYIHMADLSHENLDVSFLDDHFVAFMEWLVDSGNVNNTLFLLFADHGARFSSLRSTLQGRLEERLPMMGLALPRRLRNKFPRLQHNLQTNVHRLATPYDIHATLQHVLDLGVDDSHASAHDQDQHEQMERGASLLRPISKKRTCVKAQIAPHWCACSDLKRIRNMNHRLIQDAANSFIKFVNGLTEPHRSLCHPLKLQKILNAQMGALPENMLRFSDSKDDRGLSLAKLESKMQGGLLLLTLMTSPNDGRYEVTVLWYRPDAYHKPMFRTGAEFISRTNKYGNQPLCLMHNYPYLRPFCLCKTPEHKV